MVRCGRAGSGGAWFGRAGVEAKKGEMFMVYKWRTYEQKVPAQVVGERIEQLDKEYGEVTAQTLLDDARPEASVLHPLYEWNDTVAAEKYRLSQSGKILSELVAVEVEIPDVPIEEPLRAFASISRKNEAGRYRPIVTIMSDTDMKKQVMDNCRAEIAAVERKYKGLVDFAAILQAYLKDMNV